MDNNSFVVIEERAVRKDGFCLVPVLEEIFCYLSQTVSGAHTIQCHSRVFLSHLKNRIIQVGKDLQYQGLLTTQQCEAYSQTTFPCATSMCHLNSPQRWQPHHPTGQSWLSHQGTVPTPLIVFPQVQRLGENAAESKSRRYGLWWCTSYRSWEEGRKGLFLFPLAQSFESE